MPPLFLFRLPLAITLTQPWLEARDISDTNRIRECSGSVPWGRRTESDRRTFNERAALETRIDVTLDYLNGADPNTMASLFLMFYPHIYRKTFSAYSGEEDFLIERMPL